MYRYWDKIPQKYMCFINIRKYSFTFIEFCMLTALSVHLSVQITTLRFFRETPYNK